MTIFVTSDSHFFHKNILAFTSRPYNSVEEMNEGLIEAWNAVVKPADTVLHLGDFSFGTIDETRGILERLNGKIILHKGNHDYSKVVFPLRNEGHFELHEIGQYMKLSKQQLWFTHFPMEIGIRPNKWSIHGHIHENESNLENQINISLDSPISLIKNRPFGQPVPMDELIEYLKTQSELIAEIWSRNRSK